MTEVHEAAANGDSAQIDTLMNTGRYDANAKDQEWHDRTPMHWAAIKGGWFFVLFSFLPISSGNCHFVHTHLVHEPVRPYPFPPLPVRPSPLCQKPTSFNTHFVH